MQLYKEDFKEATEEDTEGDSDLEKIENQEKNEFPDLIEEQNDGKTGRINIEF